MAVRVGDADGSFVRSGESRHIGMSEPERSNAEALARAAGFVCEIPPATFAVPGDYRPCAPEFARMGPFALYMRACIDIALSQQPHVDSTYRLNADPLAALAGGLAEALLDGDTGLACCKRDALGRLLSDIQAASLRDPDRMRRLHFAATLRLHVGRELLAVAAELRTLGHLDSALKAEGEADDQLSRAMTCVDGMRKLNEDQIAAIAQISARVAAA
jgi:hypothetical protein